MAEIGIWLHSVFLWYHSLEIRFNEFRVAESDVAHSWNRGIGRHIGLLFLGCAGFLLIGLLAVSSGVPSTNPVSLKSFSGFQSDDSLETPAIDTVGGRLLAALPVETAAFAQSARRIVYTNAEEVAPSKFLTTIEWRAIHYRSPGFKNPNAVPASGSPTLVSLQKLLLL